MIPASFLLALLMMASGADAQTMYVRLETRGLTPDEASAGRISLDVGGSFELQPAGGTFDEAVAEAQARGLPLMLVSWSRRDEQIVVSVRYLPGEPLEAHRRTTVAVDEDDITMPLTLATLRLVRAVLERAPAPSPRPFAPSPDGPDVSPLPPSSGRPRATPIPRRNGAH
jgi:hypothetical protein